MKDTETIICPYCGQGNEIYIDLSAGEIQQYVEDCQVCCRPWQIYVDLTNKAPIVIVRTDDD